MVPTEKITRTRVRGAICTGHHVTHQERNCEGDTMAKRYPTDLAGLVSALIALDKLTGIDRMRRAGELQRAAGEVLLAEGDRGAWEATRPGNGTREGVARSLGIGVSMLDRRIGRHSARRDAAAATRRAGMRLPSLGAGTQ